MTVTAQPMGTEPPTSDERDQTVTKGESMRWEKPGPGSWTLDAEHAERRKSRWVSTEFPEVYVEGFRRGFERYGALLETIECAMVNGFTYIGPRPLGAPPEAKGAPPRPVFWLLTRLHPALRKRIKRAGEVLETRAWREDVRAFLDEDWPASIAAFERIQARPLGDLDTEALVEHLEEMRAIFRHRFLEHFRCASATMVPVGDFVVHAMDWTGCTREEALELLNGYSPYSVETVEAMQPVLDAIRADETARAILETDDDGGAILDRLRARPVVGEAVERWLARVGQRIFTGHDVTDLRGVEMPGMLVSTLRSSLDAPPHEVAREAIDEAARRLRERVPAPSREAFDELLAEARLVHPLRDARSVLDCWALGLVRRALLEAGRRLHRAGRIRDVEHVVDLTHDELVSVLRGGEGPTAEELAALGDLRARQSITEAPDVLGPAPGDPPPPEWLPPAAARVARATGVYLDMMFSERGRVAEPPAIAATVELSGLGASGGKHVGRARLVLSPADFGKIRQGDVLVARLTNPAYNILLPLIGSVVTERGGLLSHPAIVSREYGVPGVVSCPGAVTRIPDGAMVEVCGDTGTVRVLS